MWLSFYFQNPTMLTVTLSKRVTLQLQFLHHLNWQDFNGFHLSPLLTHLVIYH